MGAYSLDLRRKIVDLYERGEGSIRQLATRFAVSPDCVRRLLKQHRETGSLAPKPHAGGPKPTLQAEHHVVLRALVAADNDATLADLAPRLAEQTSVQVSPSTISRPLKALNITRKKKPQGQRKLQ
ncbi:MAG: transposase [Cyanobacteria bacterium J06638_20]